MEEKKRSYVALYNDMKCELIKEVGLTTAMVYLIIKSHKMIENNMHCCYPSNEELYKECNLKKRQFQNHLTKLVDTGWIVLRSGGTKIGRNSNYYFPREIGMYTEAELNYISKIERRSTKKDTAIFEEVPAQNNEIIEDNNIPSLAGDVLEDDIVVGNKIKEFKPKGKYVNMEDEYNREMPPESKKIIDNLFTEDIEVGNKSKEELFIEDTYKSIDEEMENYNNSMVGMFEEDNNIIPKINEEEKLKKQCDDLLTSMKWKDKTYVENGVTYGVDKNGFSYIVDEVKFNFVPTEPNKRESSIEGDEFLAYLDNL